MLVVTTKGIEEEASCARLLAGCEGSEGRVQVEGGMLGQPVEPGWRVERHGILFSIEEVTDDLGVERCSLRGISVLTSRLYLDL